VSVTRQIPKILNSWISASVASVSTDIEKNHKNQINIKIMKKIIPLLLFTLSIYGAFSQDVITYKNGKTQKVVILTTNENNITCQDFESKDQFTISRSFIASVVYQTGKTEPFGVILAKPEKPLPLVNYLIVQDTVHYQRGGGILYRGVQYTKPNDIASIIDIMSI